MSESLETLECLETFSRFQKTTRPEWTPDDQLEAAVAAGFLGVVLTAGGVLVEAGGRAFTGHFNKSGLVAIAGGAAIFSYGLYLIRDIPV